MAAPVNPTWPQGSVGFYQLLIELISIASNLSLPDHLNSSNTGVISSTTASTIISCLEKQRDLY